MERRAFLKIAGAAGAASSLAAPAVAQDRRELSMVTSWPKNFPGLGTGAQRIADSITALTGGRLSVKLYAAGELVPALEAFDAVSTGTADLYHGAAYYWQGKSTAFNFFSTIPFGLTATELNAWIYFAGGQQLWDEVSTPFGVKCMLAGNTGTQMGGWYNREIKTIDDYKGLKVRMPGLGGELLRRFGAAVVNLPAGEIFTALQSGAIDATDWVAPWNDMALGLYKVVKFYHYPGFHEPGTSLDLGVNLQVWESLSDEDRAAIEHAARAENLLMRAEYLANNANTLDVLVKEHGVQVVRFPDELLTQIGTAAGEVVHAAGQKSPEVKKVYDSYMAFRKQVLPWASISEQAIMNARTLPYEYERT